MVARVATFFMAVQVVHILGGMVAELVAMAALQTTQQQVIPVVVVQVVMLALVVLVTAPETMLLLLVPVGLAVVVEVALVAEALEF
jgi:hypothetical protein